MCTAIVGESRLCSPTIATLNQQRDKAIPNDEYITLEECIASSLHLTDCDDDGYCNHCGEQDKVADEQ